MRIITGKRKGLKLAAPKGEHTRPTEARIKESIFNILGDVSESNVCDLFAGSGAIGLEFLSRDSKLVYFIENNLDALITLKSNVNKVKLPGCVIIEKDYKTAIKIIRNLETEFDYVYVDPPYNCLDIYNHSLELIYNTSNFYNSLVLVESSDSINIESLELFDVIDKRKYRNTVIHFLRRNLV